jgi:hypothetical protein
VDDERAIMIEDFWDSNEGLLQHLQSDEYLRVLLNIEMSEAPPEIRFDEMVMRQLKRGEVVIVYDSTTEIWHVLIMLS